MRFPGIFFDLDGVLLNSLPQHLQVCRDQAHHLKLDVSVPDETEFRRLVMNGVKISPMRDFFVAVGFPESAAAVADSYYQAQFAHDYQVSRFAGVDGLLADLSLRGHKLGLVTANSRANVVPALGTAIRHFELGSQFFFGEPGALPSKAEMLRAGAASLSLSPSACLYVGDQPADAKAAADAGFAFLGVSYGWGFDDRPQPFPVVAQVADIASWVLAAELRRAA